MADIRHLQYFAEGRWSTSETERYMDIYDPSEGTIIARAPCCTAEEVNMAVHSAAKAYPAWADTPVMKRVQIIQRFRELLYQNIDELSLLVTRENGKVWSEARGDILKVCELTEFACCAPSLLMGESLMDASAGYDTVLYREPVGVFAGIAPFNFPGMIPMGWMAPLCIATGNTLVIKASSLTPLTAMFCTELWAQAGLPAGVLNIITCSRKEADLLLTHPDIRGISFVGSTAVGLGIYAKAASCGKRVQSLCEAKNHGLVLEDAPLERTAVSIINAAFGCAGERCMALPVIVVQERVADELTALLVRFAKRLKIGPASDPASELGPLISQEHRQSVIEWIERGIMEHAELLLDGRGVQVPGYESGFYLGPTLFDHVTPDMEIGNEEIFGPVLCIKRVRDFEEGVAMINRSRFANGAVIFTNSGYHSRTFARRAHAGMIGINVGIPVPIGIFPFSGHKDSFFGDLLALGKDGVRFFTETKAVTSKWFDEKEMKENKTDTWDGMQNDEK
jgi:malonate-semialdehyde dehydrogenase (acetylating)/methylmalonate-semialdehyde dehydrogenase